MKSYLARAVYVAVIAGVIASVPIAILFSIGMDAELIFTAAIRFLAFGIGASLLVGLPIALLVFQFIRRDPNFMLHDLVLIANGTGIILATIAGIWSDWMGVFFIGIPTIIAANVFALLGWRKILEPYQAEQHA